MADSARHGSRAAALALTRRQLIRRLAAGGLAVAGGSLLGAAGPAGAPVAQAASHAGSLRRPVEAPAPAQPKYGGTLVHASGYEADTLDPVRTTNGESELIVVNLMDGLVNFKRDSMQLEPAVATSWEISSDGLEYTFRIRDGIRFHDGTPCDAYAVKFNYDRVIDLNSPYHREDMAEVRDLFFSSVDRVEAPDASTVKLMLKEPFGPMLAVLGTPFMRFGSPTAIMADPDAFADAPVGNGPFKFSSWTRKANVEVVRNDDYWGGQAYLDRIVFKYVPESSVRFAEAETGSVHLYDAVGVRDLDRVRANPQLDLRMTPYPAFLYASFNLRLQPMDNKLLRQAICYAVNYDAIVRNLFNGVGKLPDAGPLAPDLTGYEPGLNPYKYDPDRAKALLSQAGLGSGVTLSMVAYNYQRPYVPAGGDKVAQAMQADLKRVGIELDLQILDRGPYSDIIRTPDKRPQIMLGGWFDDYPDQDQFIFAMGESTQALNRGFFRNDQFDQFVREARRISDESRRAQLYQQAAKLWLEEAPGIIISYGVLTSVARKSVQNAHITPLAMWRLDQAWLSDG